MECSRLVPPAPPAGYRIDACRSPLRAGELAVRVSREGTGDAGLTLPKNPEPRPGFWSVRPDPGPAASTPTSRRGGNVAAPELLHRVRHDLGRSLHGHDRRSGTDSPYRSTHTGDLLPEPGGSTDLLLPTLGVSAFSLASGKAWYGSGHSCLDCNFLRCSDCFRR